MKLFLVVVMLLLPVAGWGEGVRGVQSKKTRTVATKNKTDGFQGILFGTKEAEVTDLLKKKYPGAYNDADNRVFLGDPRSVFLGDLKSQHGIVLNENYNEYGYKYVPTIYQVEFIFKDNKFSAYQIYKRLNMAGINEQSIYLTQIQKMMFDKYGYAQYQTNLSNLYDIVAHTTRLEWKSYIINAWTPKTNANVFVGTLVSSADNNMYLFARVCIAKDDPVAARFSGQYKSEKDRTGKEFPNF